MPNVCAEKRPNKLSHTELHRLLFTCRAKPGRDDCLVDEEVVNEHLEVVAVVAVMTICTGCSGKTAETDTSHGATGTATSSTSGTTATETGAAYQSPPLAATPARVTTTSTTLQKRLRNNGNKRNNNSLNLLCGILRETRAHPRPASRGHTSLTAPWRRSTLAARHC